MFFTSTNHDKQLAALLWAPDIHSKVMLYVMSSSGHLFTFIVCIFTIEKLMQGLVVIAYNNVKSL